MPLWRFAQDCPQAGIIVLTTYPVRAGAVGTPGWCSEIHLEELAHKELLDTIRAVNSGKKRIDSEVASRIAQHLGQEDLTPRELDVLDLIRGGNKNKQIADQLSIAETTVNYHIGNIVGKLQANDRTRAGPRTFTAGNTGSNPVGDAKYYNQLG